MRNTPLKRAMDAADLSPTGLAKKSGVDPSTVYRLLAGDSDGTFPTWQKLARALDVPLTEIVPEEKP